MKQRIILYVVVTFLAIGGITHAQMTPWLYWTFLPKAQMDEIIGEASGETAWNTIMETGGYNKTVFLTNITTLFTKHSISSTSSSSTDYQVLRLFVFQVDRYGTLSKVNYGRSVPCARKSPPIRT